MPTPILLSAEPFDIHYQTATTNFPSFPYMEETITTAPSSSTTPIMRPDTLMSDIPALATLAPTSKHLGKLQLILQAALPRPV